MTIAKVFEKSVTANNSSIHDYTNPDDHIPAAYYMTLLLGFGGWLIGRVGR